MMISLQNGMAWGKGLRNLGSLDRWRLTFSCLATVCRGSCSSFCLLMNIGGMQAQTFCNYRLISYTLFLWSRP
jgi:hypothetical protein